VTDCVRYRQPESHRTRLWRWTKELGHLASLGFTPTAARFGKAYDKYFGTYNLPGEESLYINFGYWKGHPAKLDEASANLARLVAEEAAMNADDTVLDIGCGYGDQNFLWLDEFHPRQILGVNVATEQVALANSRARDRGIDGQLSYVEGTASQLPRADASVTKVTSVESAFHYPSRSDFFAEAYRVLKPSGRLVIADIVPLREDAVSPHARRLKPLGRLARSFIGSDKNPPQDIDSYAAVLNDAGFESPRVYSIRQHVYQPFAEFMRTRASDPDMKRINPASRLIFGNVGIRMWGPWMDYIIAVATKPA
jgi:cyclopropane fatty-acyl-phospholipid synthase-like methyltransferase